MIMVNLYGTKGSLICGPAVDMNLASRINDLLYESDRSNYQLVYKNWTAGKNDIAKRDRRLAVIRDNWKKIQEMIEENLPETEEMIDLLRSLNAPVEPEDMGVTAQRACEAVEVAKEVRDRYTLLQLLWDLGLAAQYAEIV